MKAPKKKVYPSGYVLWAFPDLEWLEQQYLTLEKPAKQIAREQGCTTGTVIRWLEQVGVEQRLMSEIYASRVTGDYPGNQARKLMQDLKISKACVWCGTEAVPPFGRRGVIEVHHKDHNEYNNDPDNLMYLCWSCHRLEAAIWGLLKQNKIDLVAKNNEMTITFRR